jgi:target of rapamycin complex subunit LST8
MNGILDYWYCYGKLTRLGWYLLCCCCRICSRIIKYPDSQVNRLQITPDKQFIAAAGNPHIRLYEILNGSSPVDSGSVDPPTQQPVLTLEGHTAAVTAIGFQKDGRYLYSGSEDGTIKVSKERLK